jgi:hypothetical protein
MAGLDTSIPLGVKPIDFGDPNEGRMNALRSQIMQMQMQQGQFNMMKAQRDMQYEDRQRAIAAAAVARDKAAEAQALKLYGQTGAPGYQTYSPSMEPGAASDVGMMGGGQGYTEGAVNRLAVPAQPKNFDDAIRTALQAGQFDAAKKLMAQNIAGNVNAESNLKVKKETAGAAEAGSKAASADIDLFNKQYAPHRAALVNVTSPEEAAAWTSSMYDQPTFGDMMKKLGMSKEQATAQSAQKFAENPQAWIVSQMNLDGEKAHELVYGKGKDKDKKSSLAIAQSERQTLVNQLAKDPTNQAIKDQIAQYDSLISKETKVPGTSTKTQQLQEYRDQLKTQLDKNPNNEMLQQKYDEAHAAVMRETRYGDKGLPPLDKGWTYDKESNAVLIPGSKADRDERLKAVGDRKKVVGNTGQLDEAVKNIDELLDPKNAKAFNDNFGGYVQKTTADKLTGETATTYNKIQQLKANTAKLGLDDFRVNGSIGAMTEKEWPIVQAAIASLDPKMPAADAARAIKGIRDKMQRMKDDAVDTYNLQWGGTKYHTPIKGGTGVQFGGAAPATAPAQGEVVQWGDLK